MNLEALCRMLNQTKRASFVLKNVTIVRAKKSLGDWFVGKKVSGVIWVEEGGYKTEYQFDCDDVDMIAGEIPNGT